MADNRTKAVFRFFFSPYTSMRQSSKKESREKPLWKSESKSVFLQLACTHRSRYRGSLMTVADDPTQLARQLATQMLPAIAIAAPIVLESLRPSIQNLISVVGDYPIATKIKNAWAKRGAPPLEDTSTLDDLRTNQTPSKIVVDSIRSLSRHNLTVTEVSMSNGTVEYTTPKKESQRQIDVFTHKMSITEKNANLCNNDASMCVGNLGRPRSRMPQIMGKTYNQMIENKKSGSNAIEAEHLSKALGHVAGWKDINVEEKWLGEYQSKNLIQDARVDVRSLRASQMEVKALKSYKIAVDYLKGDFEQLPNIPILCAQKPLADGEAGPNNNPIHIIDGHHRVYGYRVATMGEERVSKIAVRIIQEDPSKVLDDALNFEGVFAMDLQDNCVSGCY